MEFHLSKCQLLRVTNKRKPFPTSYDIHGHKLEVVDSAKYLGVTIHKTGTHIENINKRPTRPGFLVKETCNTKNQGCMLHNARKTIA